MQPLVSVIIPIYNVAPYLSECLESALKQSYENLDIILVDDGSSDESLDIALEFAKQDERIFVVSKPNGGLSSARNTGLEFIKGSALRGVFEHSNQSLLQNGVKKSPSRSTSGDKWGGYDDSLKSKVQSVSTTQNPPPNPLRKGGGLIDCHADFDNSTRNDGVSIDCHDSSLFNKSLESRNDINITSLTQTHSFEKAYKIITAQEINAHFTRIAPNFIKSDLERINDFITQELPANALIHFVDSDDTITSDCIEICIQNLLSKDLDIAVHNWSVLDDATKQSKKGEYLSKLKQNDYNTGLELLTHNKIYDFYFAWQGLFKADILNRYGLRYTEGIYHEDHDFGTLLFCLSGKVSYVDLPLYIYRARASSITNNQKQAAFPAQIPSFLEPLRSDFKDYKALRAYFRGYCFVVVAYQLWRYCALDRREARYFKKEIARYVKGYLDNYHNAKNFYSPKAIQMLKEMGYWNLTLWHYYLLVRSYWRNPKKFLRLFGLGKKSTIKSKFTKICANLILDSTQIPRANLYDSRLDSRESKS